MAYLTVRINELQEKPLGGLALPALLFLGITAQCRN